MSSDNQFFDPMFEFDAPQGVDLCADDAQDDANAEKWFEEKHEEPEAMVEDEPVESTEPAMIDPCDAAFEAQLKEAKELLRESSSPEHATEEPAVEPEPVDTPTEARVEAPVEATIPTPEGQMNDPAAVSKFSSSEWKQADDTEAALVEPEVTVVESAEEPVAAQVTAELTLQEQYYQQKQKILKAQQATLLESAEKHAQEPEMQPEKEPEEPSPKDQASPIRPQALSTEGVDESTQPEQSPTQACWGEHAKKKEQPKAQPKQSPRKRDMSRLLAPTASSAKKEKKTPASQRKTKRSKRTESVTPMKLTVPASPKFSAGRRAARKPAGESKTHEEIELETAQQEMERIKQERQKRKKNYEDLKAAPNQGVIKTARSNKPLTQPQEFAFRVNSRVAGANSEKPKAEPTLAEAVKKFQSATPVRFRTQSKLDKSKGPAPVQKVDTLKLTHPDSPMFATSARASTRRQRVKSTEEMQIEEFEKCQAQPFKANPVNKAIFQAHGTTGVKTTAKQPLTAPESPKFRVDQRAAMRPAANPEDESPPKRIKTTHNGPTIPISPKFQTDARGAFSRSKMENVEDEPKSFKAQPMPEFSHVFLPKASENKLTEPQPFNLAGDKFHAKAAKEIEDRRLEIAKQEVEAHNTFKAQPIREYQFKTKTPVEQPTLTEVQPFELSTDTRHAEYERKMEAEQERAEMEEKLARSFKAQDAAVLVKSPFVPKKSNKPLTEISNFELESDRRAEKREQFDQHVHEKLMQMERAKKEQEQAQFEEDKKAIAALRKQMSFKANPVKQFAGVTMKASEKSLTTPYSPALMTKSRAHMSK